MKKRWFKDAHVAHLALILLCVTGAAAAQTEPTAAEPDAKALLTGMANFISSTAGFSVKLRDGFDVPQSTGEMLEFQEKRTITLARPDRLRVENEQSDGESHMFLMDGKRITITSMPQNVYGQIEKAGTIDDAVIFFLRDLGMRLPLAAMMMNTFPAELERRVTAVEYVETTNILGAPAHHLSVLTETVDFQVWVSADSKKPLPLRVVLTYKTKEGKPQFWADFSDWDLAPAVTDATFAYTAPAGARKIPFLTELTQAAVPAGAAPTGEKK